MSQNPIWQELKGHRNLTFYCILCQFIITLKETLELVEYFFQSNSMQKKKNSIKEESIREDKRTIKGKKNNNKN